MVIHTRFTNSFRSLELLERKLVPRSLVSHIQCFEGVELLHVQTDAVSLTLVLRLQPLHWLILALLGPLYEQIYSPSG